MSDIAIKVENLSKRYRIGLKEELHDTFAGALTDFLRQPVKNMRRLRRLTAFSDDGRDAEDIIWALKDVSFEVKRGEVVGIIGRNGAGKSTLLKILSRITHPTSGRVELHGRVSSLLEVGTGFHPELTGRENIYLNGTILGMTRKEIDHKFDEIVDFSGVEKFIDTPVKRYSSGMRVRLAFSVAAHLEPEILLVDEVLAVGDAEFQKKCLGKMGDVAKEGRTVLFVSHNMGAIRNLCSRAILLNLGHLIQSGDTLEIVRGYLLSLTSEERNSRLPDDPVIQVHSFHICQGEKGNVPLIGSKDSIAISINYTLKAPIANLLLGFDVLSSDGVQIFRTYDLEFWGQGLREKGKYVSSFEMPSDILQGGTYVVQLHIGIHRVRWISRGEVNLKLEIAGSMASDVRYPGVLKPPGQWKNGQTASGREVRM